MLPPSEIITQYARAQACLKLMRESGQETSKYRIGILGKMGDVSACHPYQPGEVVLFRRDGSKGRTVTIDKPMSLEAMMRNLKRGNRNLTHTTSGVPACYVEELRVDI